MGIFNVETWIKSPNDRDIIARWTAGKGAPRSHALSLPPPADPVRFRFLVVGDTGDSESSASTLSPQAAVAREMAAEYAAPKDADRPALLLHMGDIVYMTGEKRLYDRNFRRPYAAFLTPESTADNLIFRTPFLTIPGNHDYYDLREWVLWLSRLPVVGPGLRAIIQQLFAFGMPEGGSDMGRVYMEAFVDLTADTSTLPLTYTPGTLTKLPNRYYRFRHGIVDFFALDSNTLDAPPPERAQSGSVRAEASARVKDLQSQYRSLDAELKQRQERLEEWRKREHDRISRDPSRCDAIRAIAGAAVLNILSLADSLRVGEQSASVCAGVAKEAESLASRWEQAQEDLGLAEDSSAALRLIETLEEASDDGCALLRELENCLSAIGQGEYKAGILAARDELDRTLMRWSDVVSSLPADLCDDIRDLSERALDIQRELALEHRRTRYREEDYDSAQIEWLRSGLEESIRANPDGWRIVYLHHPLYTTIGNHCENSDVQGVRGNLLEILRGRAHLVLAGHAHAFEWIRSSALPNTGIFVTGGGGQVSLRRSILDPVLLPRNRSRFHALREAGAVEWCGAGRGPNAHDGADGSLYHYLSVEVAPDVLRVRPVGVRRLGRGSYRNESPMPVYHAPALDEEGAPLIVSGLLEVEISRDGPVRPLWQH